MASTKIEWVSNSNGDRGQTWNPFVGCSRVSPGCQHCYAERMAKRLIAMGQEKYLGTVDKNGRWTGNLNFDIDNYDAPRRRKRPTVYFVNSMSDLFHESVGFNWLMRVWDVMRDTPQHTYQILTKRADVMERTGKALAEIYGVLPNVWLGVSVENQEYADKRIPHLLKTPAVMRFLSCEPLLGEVDLSKSHQLIIDDFVTRKQFDLPIIDWVIVGGESGPEARPMHPDWARGLRDQCQEAGIPFFFKQHGEWIAGSQLKDLPEEVKERVYPIGGSPRWMHTSGKFDPEYFPPDGYIPNAWDNGWDLMTKIGKGKAGRLLDGREWSEFPVIS